MFSSRSKVELRVWDGEAFFSGFHQVPSTQTNCSTGFGEVYDCWVLGSVGFRV